MTRRSRITGSSILIALLCVVGSLMPGHAAGHRPSEINVGYFLNWPTPAQFAQLKNTFDYALGLKVNWVAFETGNNMNAALASGQLQVAFSHGYVPFIAGVSSGLDLTMVGVAVGYAENDNCILHDDIDITLSTAPKLEGRRIAVQTGSASHFKLLKILAHLGVDAGRVEIVDLRDTADAAEVLQRPDVVMACAAGSALRDISALGKPLMSAAEQEKIGLRVFDIVSVPTAFMNQHSKIVQAFMDVLEASNKQWRKNPDPMRAVIARAADMDLQSANLALDSFSFPLATEQKSDAWLGKRIPEYTKEIADFFVAEGQLEKSLDSYDRFITTRFLR